MPASSLTTASIAPILERLPRDVRAKLEAAHINYERLCSWSEMLASPRHAEVLESLNHVPGVVTAPGADDVVAAVAAGTAEGARAIAMGREAIARGDVAFVVLAGGMATRMGGVVKALVEPLPGVSFLDYRIREIERLRERFGGSVPLWLMSSFATHGAIEDAVSSRRPTFDARALATFVQDASLRLTPAGGLVADAQGAPSMYATGHGDLPSALIRSKLLDAFAGEGSSPRTIWVANIDNLGATIDPAILGMHLMHGAPMTVEVVEKVGSDRGGIPARLDGRPVVLEEFRLPRTFDASVVRTFNTNTFLIDARALATCQIPWTFFEVHKKVDGCDVVQFERLLGELTSALDTRFVKVPRQGLATRFLPVKDGPELIARRPEIEAIARDRGVL